MRRAETPGYYGSVPFLLKNALDYVEGMAQDTHPYFDSRAVGLMVNGSGWQMRCGETAPVQKS